MFEIHLKSECFLYVIVPRIPSMMCAMLVASVQQNSMIQFVMRMEPDTSVAAMLVVQKFHQMER